MVILHHLNNSRSQRILWMLEELGIDYQLVSYQRDPKTQAAPPELAKVHPLGKAPVLEDSGLVIAESGVIIEHLAEHYRPELLPPAGSPQHLECSYWLQYAEASLMPLLVMSHVFHGIEKAPMPDAARPIVQLLSGQVHGSFINPRLSQHLDFITRHLEARQWFLGEALSAADFQMSFPLEALASRQSDVVSPVIHDYVKRIHATPSYQRALNKGGVYAYA